MGFSTLAILDNKSTIQLEQKLETTLEKAILMKTMKTEIKWIGGRKNIQDTMINLEWII